LRKLLNTVAPFVALLLAIACFPALGQDDLTESPDGPEAVKVYFTQDEALAKVFAKADTLWTEEWSPSPQERKELEGRLGWRVDDETFAIHRAGKDGQDLGYAVITEEQGRFKPITFIVKMSAERRVDMVLVMVYRESRGDGVKRQRFLGDHVEPRPGNGRQEGPGHHRAAVSLDGRRKMTGKQLKSRMRLSHRWVGVAAAAVLLVTSATGVLLQHPSWLGPPGNPPLALARDPHAGPSH